MPQDTLIPAHDHKSTQHAVKAMASPDSVHLVNRSDSRPEILLLLPTPFFA